MGSKYFFGTLALISSLVWLGVLTSPDKNLHLIACDVGQGDAILIEFGQLQILIDGGPNDEILNCLAQAMPFWDKRIEIVILTHPETDHYQGLIDVFQDYNVEKMILTRLEASSQDYQVLRNLMGGGQTEVIEGQKGKVIRVGLIELDILHPGKTLCSNPNDCSIVTQLKYGQFEGLFTGDIGPEAIEEILANNQIQDVEYIKVPHHGSKNGLTQSLLQASQPEVAVISVGKNPWGHPHREILELLKNNSVQTYRTDRDGQVEIITDGQSWWVKTSSSAKGEF